VGSGCLSGSERGSVNHANPVSSSAGEIALNHRGARPEPPALGWFARTAPCHSYRCAGCALMEGSGHLQPGS